MASERWAGFTDEDIERIKLYPNSTTPCPIKMCEMEGYTPASKNRGPMKIKKIALKSEKNEYPEEMKYKEVNSVSSDCEAQKDFILPNKKSSTLKSSDENFRETEIEGNCTCNNYVFEENERTSLVCGDNTDVYHENDPKCKEADESSSNLLPLEIFEMRQKRVEAENARRRALISKAINDKKMRTQAEAIKLAKITQELNRIDSNLSADVSILRNYIEKASQEFSEAEKRYLKAEKEFVEAKLVLFDKMQRKEMLTEHLCAIIEQNENRKADKLVELMQQLEMEVVLDECEINRIPSILPNLCTLNDEPYHTCQTLKPSLSSTNSLEKSTSEISETSECEARMDEVSHEVTESSNAVNVKNNSCMELKSENV